MTFDETHKHLNAYPYIEAFLSLHGGNVDWYPTDTFTPTEEREYLVRMDNNRVSLCSWRNGRWDTSSRVNAYYPLDGESL